MKTTFYKDCDYCDGEGGHSEYCCSGMDDGVQSCGCAGRGTWKECHHCDDGKVEHDEIEWDFETLDDEDKHNHQTYYSILGKGIKYGEEYTGAAIYTHGELDEIVDVEIR